MGSKKKQRHESKTTTWEPSSLTTTQNYTHPTSLNTQGTTELEVTMTDQPPDSQTTQERAAKDGPDDEFWDTQECLQAETEEERIRAIHGDVEADKYVRKRWEIMQTWSRKKKGKPAWNIYVASENSNDSNTSGQDPHRL